MSNESSTGLDSSVQPGHNGRLPLEGPRPAPVEEHAIQMDLPKVTTGTGVLIGSAILVLLAAMFFLGWSPHARRLETAQTDAAETTGAKPLVDVIAPKLGKEHDALVLPADVRPNQMTSIFARATGYLKPLPAGIDIGARVNAGQVIAEIAAPDLDAQLEQARASLEQAKVAALRTQQELALSQTTLTRYEEALKNRAVSAQDVEERRTQQSVEEASFKEAQANTVALDAAVKRLQELQSFQKVTAPFSGVITFRGYDTGALISGADSAAGKEIFRLEQTDVLRVAVNVPQSYLTDIKLGQSADILVRNYPGSTFPGTIARSSGSVDPATRTMRVEVDVPNSDGRLLPGMYGQVRIPVHRVHPALTLPTSALVFGAEGVRIAVVENGLAKYRNVTLGRDLGVEVEVVTGLTDGDQVINNPGSLVDGSEVAVRLKK